MCERSHLESERGLRFYACCRPEAAVPWNAGNLVHEGQSGPSPVLGEWLGLPHNGPTGEHPTFGRQHFEDPGSMSIREAKGVYGPSNRGRTSRCLWGILAQGACCPYDPRLCPQQRVVRRGVPDDTAAESVIIYLETLE